MKRIVFYGTCQAAALTKVYNTHIAPSSHTTSVWVNHSENYSEAERLDLRTANLLVVEVATPKWVEAAGRLPSDAPRVLFPSIAGRFLWPFGGQYHPKSTKLIRRYDAQLGDSFLNRKVRQNADIDDAINEYMNLDVGKVVDLDRLLEMSLDQQRQRDEATGFSFATFIAESFRSKYLFLTPDHPNLELARRWALEILKRVIPHRDLDRVERCLTSNPFPTSAAPIHPSVIRHFGLTFLPDKPTYPFFYEGRLTFAEFAGRYLRHEWNADLEDGLTLVQAGKREEAKPKLLVALQKSPKSYMAHAELALIFADAGQVQEALGHSRQAVLLGPEEAYAHVRLSQVLNQSGQIDEAEVELRRAIELEPSNPGGHAVLSHLLTQQQRHEEALAAARRVADLSPQDLPIYSHMARLLFRLNRLDEAERELRNGLALAPDNLDLLNSLSHLLTTQQRDAEAVEVGRRIADLDPRNASIRGHVAQLLLRLNRSDEAESEIRNVLTLTPDNPGLLNSLSHLLTQQQRHEEALEAARRVADLSPQDLPIYAHMSRLLFRLDRFDEAEREIRKGLALAPDNPGLLATLSHFLANRQRDAEAVEAGRRVAELEPGNTLIRGHVAQLLLRLNRFGEAEAVAQAAIAVAPERALFHEQLARALDGQGRRDEAIAAMRRAAELDDANPHLHGLLRKLLERAGRLEPVALERPAAFAPDEPARQAATAQSSSTIDGEASGGQPAVPAPEQSPEFIAADGRAPTAVEGVPGAPTSELPARRTPVVPFQTIPANRPPLGRMGELWRGSRGSSPSPTISGFSPGSNPEANPPSAASDSAMRFDHIGVVVPNLAQGRDHFAGLFGVVLWTEEFCDQVNDVLAQFGLDASGVCYEIIAPLGPGSPIAQALRRGQRILNHIAYRVPDLQAAAERLQAQGCMPATKPSVAIAYGGRPVQFFATPLGFLAELIEAPDHAHKFTDIGAGSSYRPSRLSMLSTTAG